MTCLLCALEHDDPGASIYRDRSWSVGIHPGLEIPGWMVIRARYHREGWHGLDPGELASIGPLIGRVSQAVQEVIEPDRVYQAVFGDKLAHFHTLVAPHHLRNGPSGPLVLVDRPPCDADEALRVAAAVGAALTARQTGKTT